MSMIPRAYRQIFGLLIVVSLAAGLGIVAFPPSVPRAEYLGRGTGGAAAESDRKDLPFEGTVAVVIDGDTVRLSGGHTVRLAGVDTPETVHPNKPVETFGKEASAFTRRHLAGEKVRLRYDDANRPTNHRDRYGRLVAYVQRVRDGLDFNAELVRQGYAHAYTKYPLARNDEFRGYEREAREAGRGLWASIVNAPASEPPSGGTAGDGSSAQTTVYVTKAGAKYHREGCRYLPKSRIPVGLEEARKRYSPCSVCNPPK